MLITLTAFAILAAQSPAQSPAYDRRDLTIPMRDGVALNAVALVPKGAAKPLPIILIRTPFGAAREFRSADLPASLRELGQDGYIFVAQDVRGRGGSQGTFVTARPLADPKDPKGTDESTDAWDTIDWLVKRMPGHNGRVGVIGVSYRGWLAGMAGIRPHPALRAISPQGPMVDTWMGDDFFQQGAFRQTQGVLYSAYVEGKGDLEIPDADLFAFYLRLGTLDSIARTTRVFDLPSWTGFRTHPAYDDYWKARSMARALTRAAVPTLFVGGWWDEEDILGAQLGYRTVERRDPKGWNHVVLGPWSHNAWIRPGGDSLGPIRFGSATADHFRERIQRPWLAHHLHGTGDGRFPEAWAFETGGRGWRSFATWPPKGATPRRLHLRENGTIAFAPSSATANAFDAFRADPADPVPQQPRPVTDDGASTWLVRDQRFLQGRPDVLTWVSAPLTEDLVIAGDVTARLFASTTGSDADWVVKLIDVHPDTMPERPAMSGYQLMVSAGIMRGRYWKGFDRATPITPNTVTPFTVDLHQQLYRFRKGHRLMVQVQSSWFPLYDRNPQTFVPNIFQAKATDFKAAEHRIWRSARYPSHVVVNVLR